MPSCFSRVRLFVTPWTIGRHVLLSLGCSRQEYWSGLPLQYFLLQGTIPTQESNTRRYVSCAGKWVLYHQCHLALGVKVLRSGSFLVGQVPSSSPWPWCLLCPLGPCYCFLPLFSSLPLWSSPFFKPQDRSSPSQGLSPDCPEGKRSLSTRTSQVPSSVPFLLHADVLLAPVCLPQIFS